MVGTLDSGHWLEIGDDATFVRYLKSIVTDLPNLCAVDFGFARDPQQYLIVNLFTSVNPRACTEGSRWMA